MTYPGNDVQYSDTWGPGFVPSQSMKPTGDYQYDWPTWKGEVAKAMAANVVSGVGAGYPSDWNFDKHGRWDIYIGYGLDQDGMAPAGLVARIGSYLEDYKPGGSSWVDSNFPMPAKSSKDYIESPEAFAFRIQQEEAAGDDARAREMDEFNMGLAANQDKRAQEAHDFNQAKFFIEMAADNAYRASQRSGGGGGGSPGGVSPSQKAQLDLTQKMHSDEMAFKWATFEMEKELARGQLDLDRVQVEADVAYKRALQANMEFEQGLKERQLGLERANTIAALGADPGDAVQREFMLRAGAEPTGTPVNVFSGQPSGNQQKTLSQVMQEQAPLLAPISQAAISGQQITPEMGMQGGSAGPQAQSQPQAQQQLAPQPTLENAPPQQGQQPQGGQQQGGQASSQQEVMGGPLGEFIRSLQAPKKMAGGSYGYTNDEKFIVGDSLSGQPTGVEELVENPTGAPIKVIPLSQRLKRFATGTTDYWTQAQDVYGDGPGYGQGAELNAQLYDMWTGAGAPAPTTTQQKRLAGWTYQGGSLVDPSTGMGTKDVANVEKKRAANEPVFDTSGTGTDERASALDMQEQGYSHYGQYRDINGRLHDVWQDSYGRTYYHHNGVITPISKHAVTGDSRTNYGPTGFPDQDPNDNPIFQPGGEADDQPSPDGSQQHPDDTLPPRTNPNDPKAAAAEEGYSGIPLASIKPGQMQMVPTFEDIAYERFDPRLTVYVMDSAGGWRELQPGEIAPAGGVSIYAPEDFVPPEENPIRPPVVPTFGGETEPPASGAPTAPDYDGPAETGQQNEYGYTPVTRDGVVTTPDGGGTVTAFRGDYIGLDGQVYRWNSASGRYELRPFTPTTISNRQEFNALPPDVQQKIKSGQPTGYFVNFDLNDIDRYKFSDRDPRLSREEFNALPWDEQYRLWQDSPGGNTPQMSQNANTWMPGAPAGAPTGMFTLPQQAPRFDSRQPNYRDYDLTYNVPESSFTPPSGGGGNQSGGSNQASGGGFAVPDWLQNLFPGVDFGGAQQGGGNQPPAGGTQPVAGGNNTPPAGGNNTPPAGGNNQPPAGGGGNQQGNGNDPWDNINVISYGNEAWRNLPLLNLITGDMPLNEYENLGATPIEVPALGITLPAPNQLNYGDLLYLQENAPGALELLSSLYKAGNQDLGSLAASAASFAPLGQAHTPSLISTG